ncbi:MAG: YaeQ family protein [Deltaproteobacteria bacterium]|nr:YaeQ family protein [Deltaproteobacteria bacterium]
MANPSTLYRFRIALSDVDRGVYESLDLRVPMHPSESVPYLLTRVLAYALNYEDGLALSKGLCDPDEPAMSLPGVNGGIAKWIDIGNPAARRLHKASKAARLVRVYTYKDPESIKREAAGEQIHRAGEIEIFSFDGPFMKSLEAQLERDNEWTVLHNDAQLVVTIGDENIASTVHAHRLEV